MFSLNAPRVVILHRLCALAFVAIFAYGPFGRCFVRSLMECDIDSVILCCPSFGFHY